MDYLNQPLATSMNNQNNAQPVATPAPDAAPTTGTTYDYIKNGVTSAKDSFNKTVEDISSKDLYTSGKEFIESNTIVTKLVFLILILIFFLILMNLGIFLVIYFSTPDKNPFLVDGMIAGNRSKTIYQDPKNANAITLYRSNNQSDGIEFTWSVWLLRNELSAGAGTGTTYENIFNKGSDDYTTNGNGKASLGNAPGVYFKNTGGTTNQLEIFMDTISDNGMQIEESETIDNLPLGRWFHLAIRMENKIMDVYVNGVVTKRVAFENVPFQNYRNVYVCNNGGFNGNLSDLRYFDNALSVFQIMNTVEAGPNTRSSDADRNTKFTYLSNNWYMN